MAYKGVEVVLCNIHSCCSRDRRVVKDKGIVCPPDPKECTGNDLTGSVVEAVGRANQVGRE